MHKVHVRQDGGATTRSQITLNYQIPINIWYSFYQSLKDERLIGPKSWLKMMIFNREPVDSEFSTLPGNFSWTACLFHSCIADKVFKNGPSKNCKRRQSSADATWSISKYIVSHIFVLTLFLIKFHYFSTWMKRVIKVLIYLISVGRVLVRLDTGKPLNVRVYCGLHRVKSL